MKKFICNSKLLYIGLFISLLLGVIGIMPRISDERTNKTVAFVIGHKEMTSLAYQNKMSMYDVWNTINRLGVCGITVPEYTGDEIELYNPMCVVFGTAENIVPSYTNNLQSGRAVISFPSDSEYAGMLTEYLKLKLPMSETIIGDKLTYILLPGTVDEMRFSSFLPDFGALDFTKKYSIPVLLRPGPCTPSSGKETAEALSFLAEKYGNIRNILPAGLVVAGNPDFDDIVDVMKKHDITLSQVEFIKQAGFSQFAAKAGNLVIPFHSLTRDEIISRIMSRQTIRDRFVRAVHERSIRIILVHPYDLQMGGHLEIFKEDLADFKNAIEARGYNFGWPSHINERGKQPAGALACGFAAVFCLWFYCVRLKGMEREKSGIVTALLLSVISVALGAVMYKVSFAAKIMGGFCGAIAATEGALTALDTANKRFLKAAANGLFVILIGGLAIASFYGTSDAALRLTPFSGVKLTLLLPPFLLVVHDLVRRLHPESIGEIVVRPAIWGELVLIGVMLIGVAVMAIRSDNVSNVPAAEIAFRDFIERLMLVRPRTKEFLIGYPALVLYWYIVKMDYIPKYREVVRLAASLAFASVVNTFCHFHTLVFLSVIRVLNGWWLGMMVGVAAVCVLHFTIKYVCRAEDKN
ncbi:MAG: DUF5693 family protein [Synergistes sp.]|nr:DUF5693 family protein [Synergistes sp.]